MAAKAEVVTAEGMVYGGEVREVAVNGAGGSMLLSLTLPRGCVLFFSRKKRKAKRPARSAGLPAA